MLNKKGRGIFITGTDTGAGKTIVCGYLARYLRQSGFKVITQKWIQTGCKYKVSSDINTHLRIMGEEKKHIKEYLGLSSPYIFKHPSSPHLASRLAGEKISAGKIKESFKLLSRSFDFVIAEGTGGVLVPFSQKKLVIGIAGELDLPVLIVAQNKLGVINHALLSVEALRARNIKVLGIVFSNSNGVDQQVLKDNPRIIKALSRQKIFGVLPFKKDYRRLYGQFIPIAEKILKDIGLNRLNRHKDNARVD